ncbi:MAG: polynucleotide adenylyltransferase PcnB [Pseudomonadota bacterium]
MIRKLLRRVFSRPATEAGQPLVVACDEHGITRDRISPCARKVTTALQEHGHAAFVVGGAVRDLLLGREPKDFDVATDAHPEQVRDIFRRSRIIGRRFRLVHVMCGQETVEVATFRGSNGGADSEDSAADEHGRILRDNVFGSQEEDAKRRDFTVNALFYDPTTEEIWDYCGGVADVRARTLRMIGDPEQRYREDPVRMLRAVRLAAKLGMDIEPATRAPIKPLAERLHQVPPARLFDEMLKLLLSGHARECIVQLRREGLHHGLLPLLDVILEQPLGERFVMLALEKTDQRVREDKPVSPSFLFAALLWHEVLAAWKVNEAKEMKPSPALTEAMHQVAEVQAEKLAIPRRFSTDMKDIWAMQLRLMSRSGVRPYRLLENPRFRAGYDFLLLRCESGEVDAELGGWWERFQHAGEEERKAMLQPGPKKRRRRTRRKKSEGAGEAGATQADSADEPQPK